MQEKMLKTTTGELYFQSQGRRLLSIPQVAKYLNLSEKYLYNRCHKKSKNPLPFPVKRIGRRCLVDIRDLKRYVESL